MLQGTDKDQEARQRIKEAVEKGEPARVLIRNYRPDGTLFWNETVIQPVRDASGRITHFIGYHRDASDRLRNSAERLTTGLPPWLREDRLTGLHSRAYFEELLQRDWMLAQRDSHEIGLTLFDIDDLGTYNETFEKTGGDACIRRVARVIGASYRRGGDLVGRWEGGTFAVLTQGDAAEKASHYAQVVGQRVRDLLMHHPRARLGALCDDQRGSGQPGAAPGVAARGASEGHTGGAEALEEVGQEQYLDRRGRGLPVVSGRPAVAPCAGVTNAITPNAG